MNVLSLQMLLHYYARASEYQGAPGDGPAHLRSAAVADAYDDLCALELLERTGLARGGDPNKPAYVIAERGRVYVESLKMAPLPIKRWVAQ